MICYQHESNIAITKISCFHSPDAVVSVNSILFKYKVHRDTTDSSYIYNTTHLKGIQK